MFFDKKIFWNEATEYSVAIEMIPVIIWNRSAGGLNKSGGSNEIAIEASGVDKVSNYYQYTRILN